MSEPPSSRLHQPRSHSSRTGSGVRLVALAAVVALVLVIIGGVLAKQNYDTKRSRTQDQARMLAQAAAIDADRYLHSRIELLETIANREDLLEGDAQAIDRYLAAIDNVSLGFEGGMAWVDTTGTVEVIRGVTNPVTGVSLADRDYFQAVMANGETFVGQAVIGRVGTYPVVPIAAPTRNKDGQINGVLVGTIRLDTLSNQSKQDIFGNVSVVILDRADQVIVDRVPVTELRPFAGDSRIATMRGADNGVLADQPDLSGDGRYDTGYAAAPFGDWLVLVEQSVSESMAEPRRQLQIELGILVIAGLGGIGSVGIVARRLDKSGLQEQRAREEADRAQARFRRLLESGVLPAAITSREGEVLEANEAFTRLFCDSAVTSIRGRLSLREVISDESGRDFDHLLEHIQTEGRVKPHDLVVLTGNGPLSVLAGGAALQADGEAAIFLIDVSEQKRTEQALQESEERLRNAIDAARLATWEYDPATGMLTWHSRRSRGPATVRMGFADYLTLVHPDDRPRVADLFNEAATGAGEVLLEYQRLVDGEYEGRSIRGHAVRDAQGAIVLFRGVSAEVTERLALERARQSFVDGVAHDLKNPLTAIKAQSDLVRRRLHRQLPVEPDWLEQRVSAIEASAGQAARQLDELADLAHLEAGTPLELRRGPVDLVEIARSAVEAASRMAEHREIRLFPGPERLVGMWDALRLSRAVGNLIGNALKYSPDHMVVTVTIRRDGDMALLEVADHGIGIPAEELDGIFSFRHRATNVGGVQGSGVGLAAAAQIVELHGGSISVQSVEGAGSTFTIKLPLRPQSRGESPANPSVKPALVATAD